MKNSKNARELLLELSRRPKPDLSRIVLPECRAPQKESRTKPTPAEATGLTNGAPLHREPARRRLCYDLTTSRRAAQTLGRLPSEDESFHCIMGGDYHGFDLVIAVHELAAARIDELHLATLGFNRHNISHLCAMIDADAVGPVHLLCSEYFSSADFETYGFARAELSRRGCRCLAARNHAKILLFAIGSARYVIESSANLRSCNNLEQFALHQSPTLYAFHRAWIERVLTHAAG